MPISSARWKIADGVAHEAFDGAAVVLNLDSGVYYKLNAVAASAWNALRKPVDLESLIERLLTEWEVDRRTLAADLQEMLAELEQLGLVVRAPE